MVSLSTAERNVIPCFITLRDALLWILEVLGRSRPVCVKTDISALKEIHKLSDAEVTRELHGDFACDHGVDCF